MFAKKIHTAAALAVAMLAAPGIAAADGNRAAMQIEIKVSCARYLLPNVIWDRPMATFLDDLTAAGYSPERAFAIGNRVCRDDALVGNPDGLGARMRAILRSDPPRG